MESSSLQLPLKLFQQFEHLNWYCAVSAGADSIALMHLIKSQFPEKNMTVFSVDHQWSNKSSTWVSFVRDESKKLGMDFLSFKVSCEKKSEQCAREERIKVYKEVLQDNGVIFLAHHLDDQIETSLWRWMRGNWDQLYGMDLVTPISKGFLIRPLLNVSKDSIRQYISDNNIPFIEDPSNCNLDYTRNFLRHSIVPKLKAFNEDFVGVFKSAQTRYEDRHRKINEIYRSKSLSDNTLDLNTAPADNPFCMKLSVERWLKSLDLPYPSAKALDEFTRQCFDKSIDRHPRLSFGKSYVLSFYQNKIFVNTIGQLVIQDRDKEIITKNKFSWNNTSYRFVKAVLPQGKWVAYRPSKRQMIYCDLYPKGIRVCLLWKNLGISPSMRNRYPMIEHNGHFVQLGELCFCPKFKEKGEYFTYEQS